MPAHTKRSKKKAPDCAATDSNVARARQRVPKKSAVRLDDWEFNSAVMKYWMRGYSNQEILDAMEAEFGEAGKMGRETPTRILRYVAKMGYLLYNPPYQLPLAYKIRDKFKWLKTVDVVNTMLATDVARAAAKTLLELVQEFHDSYPDAEEVNIAMAAGLSTRTMAQALADMLAYPGPDDMELPKRIAFHSLVSGHSPGSPTTSPNAYFSYFVSPPDFVVERRFVGLHAPAIVRTRDIPRLMQTPEIAEAFAQVPDLDIIVTSGADWNDPHGSLRSAMEQSPSSLQRLLDKGTVCDMMWRPLSRKAPVEVQTEMRALTLMELSDLPDFRRTKRVLLMLGPCAQCNRSKESVLETILAQEEHLVTNIVIDSRTAREVVKAIKAKRI